MRITILSTADFDAELWTNKQYLAAGLAARGHEVTYLNSIGLRAPRLSASDSRRILQRIRRRVGGSGSPDGRAGTAVDSGVRVRDVNLIPLHRSSVVRDVNRALSQRYSRELDGEVFWTFSPLTYGLERSYERTVYHSVDFLHSLPRVPADTLLSAETDLLGRADAVIGSSKPIVEHLARTRPDAIEWENVADTSRFSAYRSDVRDLGAVFGGNLTTSKIDVDLLMAIVDLGIPLTIAGPIEIDGTRGTEEFDRLLCHRLVDYRGVLDLESLARLYGRATVGLIPYKVNSYTEGVFPLKVYEYLAAGLQVVSTNLPSLEGNCSDHLLTTSGAEFATVTARAHASELGVAGRTRIAESVRSNSWSDRIDQAEELLGALLDGADEC